MLNKKLIFTFAILILIFSINGCIPDGKRNTNTDVSEQSGGLNNSDTSSDISFDLSGEYAKIAGQLDELEKVLDALDQFSQDDLEIPQP